MDTLGHLLEVFVFPADTQDREGARAPIDVALVHHGCLGKICVDSGSNGPEFVYDPRTRSLQLEIEVVPRSGATTRFKGLPKRWVVERTFA